MMDAVKHLASGLSGEGWTQLGQLALAFALSSLIGLEREIRLRSAGLRTHALVGLSAALLMLVSKYGFADALVMEHVVLDPSRVAAQIVSGIGFIGGGLIFVRKDIVHGLTTAAAVWLTAAIGMACGGGLPLLAAAATCGHFIVVFGYTRFMSGLHETVNRLHIRYRLGHNAAAEVMTRCSAMGFTVLCFTIARPDAFDPENASVELRVQGRPSVAALADALMHMPDIVSVTVNPPENGE